MSFDNAPFAVPLPSNTDRQPVSPVMLAQSQVIGALVAGLSSSTMRYIGGIADMASIHKQINAGSWQYDGNDGQDAIKAQLLSEVAAQASRFVGDKRILNFSAAVYTFAMPYGERIRLDRGIHIDPPSQKPNSRTIDIVMATPTPTLLLPEMSVKKMHYTGSKGRFITPSTPGLGIVAAEPGQYVAMPENTVHASPDMSRYCTSYEAAQECFAGKPELLKYFRPDGYTRDFVTARACYGL